MTLLMDRQCLRCWPGPVVTAAVTIDVGLDIPGFLRRDNGAEWDATPPSQLKSAPSGLNFEREDNLTESDKLVIAELQRALPSSVENTKKRLAALKTQHEGQRYDRKRKIWVDVVDGPDRGDTRGRPQGVSGDEHKVADSKPRIDTARLPEGHKNWFD